MEKKDFIAIIGLLVLVVIFFLPAATLKEVFITGDVIGSDIWDFNFPARTYYAQSIKTGKLPLWSPRLFCGYPLLAEGQIGAFYPPNLLLNLLLPAAAAYTYSTLLVFFMAAFFTYLYARSLKLGLMAAVVAATIFAFSGFMLTHLKHLSLITAAAWLPLNFFLVEAIFKHNKINVILRFFLFLALAVALQLFAGHINLTFIVLAATTCYFIFKLFSGNKSRGLYLFLFSLALLLGIALTAIQLLPTYELVQFSGRAGMGTAEWSQPEPFRFADFITLVKPFNFGNPATATYDRLANGTFWEKCAYVGIIPLWLIAIAIFRKYDENYVVFFTIILVAAIILALMPVVPGYSLLFRFPGRFLILFEFAAAILAGFALNLLKGKKGLILFFLLFTLIVADLYFFNSRTNATYPAEEWLKEPESVKFLKKDDWTFRLYSFRHDRSWQAINKSLARGWLGNAAAYKIHQEILPPNASLLYGLNDCFGYSPLEPRRQKILFYGFYRDDLFNPNWVKMLGMFNVKYLLSHQSLKDKNLKLVKEIRHKYNFPTSKIYRNKTFLPRAFVVPGARYLSKGEEIVKTIWSAGFDPRAYVILEEEINWGSKQIKNVKLKIKNYEPEKVEIGVSISDRGFLVMSDSYYPGWKVLVDGKEKRILRANYVMRAVALDKGKHLVEFVYQPESFLLGCKISGIALVLLLSGLWINRRWVEVET
ncbi:YfhO family protein [Candidatus Margulisiibacteriota bacterium]